MSGVHAVVDREREQVGPASGVEPEPRRERDLLVGVRAHEGLVHVVAPQSVERRALPRVPELLVDVVAPHVAADRRIEPHAADVVRHAVSDVRAVERAPIHLLDLVAVVGIGKVQGEVRIEIEAVGPEEGEGRDLAFVGGTQLVAHEELVPSGVAPLAGIDGAEPCDEPAVHRSRGNLPRAVPVSRVARFTE
jgi:hypothetical protein